VIVDQVGSASNAKLKLQALGRAHRRCRLCPRLVRHREALPRIRPDAIARILLGTAAARVRRSARAHPLDRLAPARTAATERAGCSPATGVGDCSSAAPRRGFANQPSSVGAAMAWSCAMPTSPRRSAARHPRTRTPVEMTRCQPFLLEELRLLQHVRVAIALGKIGWDAYLARAAGRWGRASAPAAPFRPRSDRRDARRHHAPRQASTRASRTRSPAS